MSSGSYKNLLQEWCQSRKIPTPKYKSVIFGGSDHNPLWRSEVHFHSGEVYGGEISTSKRNAEQSAALFAIKEVEAYRTVEPDDIHTFNLDQEVTIYIDVENVPLFLEEFITRVECPQAQVIPVVSQNHPLKDKLLKSELLKRSGVYLAVIPSTRKDAADIGITLYIGMQLTYHIAPGKCKYIIATGDHFAYAIADCINNYWDFIGKSDQSGSDSYQPSAFVCRTVDDVIKILKLFKSKGL